MRRAEKTLRLSATDLMWFRACRHATTLDLRRLEVGDIEPGPDGEEAEHLQRQGDAHELAFLQSLKDNGRTVIEIAKDGVPLDESVLRTRQAMEAGVDVIFQGAFLSGAWSGYSDFLERVERPSRLGPWSYEVTDTKLKRSPDPKHLLQLVLYSDLLAEFQGIAPEAAHLQLGDGTRFTVQLDRVSAYARHARERFEAFLKERPTTVSEPVASCGLCRWRDRCQQEWEENDSLALVAGITRSQRHKLEAAGIITMAGLAVHSGRVPQLAPQTLVKLQTQAKLQSERRRGSGPRFELRLPEQGRGFDLLPRPDAGDVFYDIEGDPYYPGGLEYLHGLWFRGEEAWAFDSYWAHDRAAEGKAIASLLDVFSARMKTHPGAHIYHYGNYEIDRLRKLAAAHGVGEAALDQLLRERRFVDLLKVVSGGLIASEKGYSIKDLEAFYMPKRDATIATAGASVIFYEKWRETGDRALLDRILDYNRTDCVSTQLLRDWLVQTVRPATRLWPVLGNSHREGGAQRVSEDDAALAEHRARFEPLRARLGDDVASLLFDLNYFHAREDRPKYWAIFDRLEQESETLLDDLDCIAGLEATGPAVPDKQSTERTYRFPPQETKLRAGKRPCIKPADQPEAVNLVAIDRDAGLVTLRRGRKAGELPDRLDLIPEKPRDNRVMRAAISAVSDGISSNSGVHRAVEHLLTRTPPMFIGGSRPDGIVDPSQDLVLETSRAIAAMDRTTLAIQGPPGTGKSYISAWAILDLVRAGKRVAVSSHTHKAIVNLLDAVADRAAKLGETPLLVRKKGSDDEDDADAHGSIRVVTDNDASELDTADVVGGTAWLFARASSPTFDYLFVDEAGQVSLANIVAMSRAAHNIVLVGDPMQLPQPLQGNHPGRSGQSALEYLIDGHRVIPPNRGIFMPTSRRMHTDVCTFISRAVYEGRLANDPAAARQSLHLRDGTPALGARLEPIVHRGRSQSCPEEVEAIRQAIAAMEGATYRDREGEERVLARSDILVVAPYNAQVNALADALPGVRVGTVDKFQGQEAPVCFVSMTTSSGEEMPRDIEFLFSLNRINVAVSRAQARAVVFASPLLLEIPCRTLRDITLVNTLCLLNAYRGPA